MLLPQISVITIKLCGQFQRATKQFNGKSVSLHEAGSSSITGTTVGSKTNTRLPTKSNPFSIIHTNECVSSMMAGNWLKFLSAAVASVVKVELRSNGSS